MSMICWANAQSCRVIIKSFFYVILLFDKLVNELLILYYFLQNVTHLAHLLGNCGHLRTFRTYAVCVGEEIGLTLRIRTCRDTIFRQISLGWGWGWLAARIGDGGGFFLGARCRRLGCSRCRHRKLNNIVYGSQTKLNHFFFRYKSCSVATEQFMCNYISK